MTAQYLDPTTLARLQGLELRARTIVEGHLSGLHRSPRQGFSVEFAEHRNYAAGDDLRYLDWKVFGKRDRFYLKQFEQETNLVCHIVIDVSESMSYRSNDSVWSKFDYAATLGASLAWLVLKQQDAVGLALVDTEIRTLVRPSGQASHLKPLIASIESAQTQHGSNLGSTLHELANRISRNGVVIVISDLFDDLTSLASGLKHLKFQGHDVSILQVIDPAEIHFPFEEPTEFEGLESTGRTEIEPQRLADAYRVEFQEFLQSCRRMSREMQIDLNTISTDEPPDRALFNFLAERRHRRSRS